MAAGPSPSDSAAQPKPRIFVVEDEAVVALEIIDQLRRAGFEVCGHATRAETALEEIPASRPDLVLLDIKLGGANSGLEVADALRRSFDVPIVFLTAYADAELTARAAGAVSYGYVTKPFDARVLKVNIDLALALRAAHRALREREELLRVSQEVAHVGSWRVDLATGRITWSDETYRLHGQSRAAFVPTEASLLALAHPDDRAKVQAWIAAALTGAPDPLEVRIVLPDGSTRILEGRGDLVRAPDGAPVSLVGTVHDVTATRRHAAALEVLSTGLARSVGEAFFAEAARRLAEIAGADMAFVRVLDPAAPRTPRTVACIVDGALRPAEVRAPPGPACEEVLARAEPVTVAERARERFPDDAELAALGAEAYCAAPLLGAEGEVLGCLGIAARSALREPGPIAAIVTLFAVRAAAELERQRIEARFVGVFEHSPDALLIVDAEGRIVLANRVAADLFGHDTEALRTLTVEALVPEARRGGHADLRRRFHAQPQARRMGASRSRLFAVRKDGREVPVEISLGPMQVEGSTFVVAAVRDVSDRVRADREHERLEAQFVRAQRMEALGTLAGGIAHDFNNLLAVIAANAQLAQMVPAGAPVAEHLEEISTAASRAAELVRQILAFGRPQPQRRVSGPLSAIVDEVAKLLRATLPAGIELAVEIADAPHVVVDPSQIHQVLMNLCTNAWQAIDRTTGRVLLRLRAQVVDGGSSAPDLAPGTYARLDVVDDGAGMDAGTLEHIFEPFFTTKRVGEGTGLGLSVTHGIVSSHGGAIRVESAPGRGSTFSVLLPAAPGPEGAHRGAGAAPVRRGSARVLLVDDEPTVARVTERLLRRLGYEVRAFEDADAAVAAVRADPQAFDVVLTDQHMPRMGGLDVARAVRALRPDLVIVLVSGNRVHTDEELRAAHVEHTLAKPFSMAELGEVLERALRGR